MTSDLFTRIGGEAAVRQLVNQFYDLMDNLDEAQQIRHLHSQDLSQAREKLFLFLCGWLGGPQLYIEKFGHPRLRQRHLPFAIGISERDQWMLCMTRAMQELAFADDLQQELTLAFFRTADFMRNQE